MSNQSTSIKAVKKFHVCLWLMTAVPVVICAYHIIKRVYGIQIFSATNIYLYVVGVCMAFFCFLVVRRVMVLSMKELSNLQEESACQAWGLEKTNSSIKKLYKELEKKNEELQAKNADLMKLDELKSEFVSTVSHELRTPLAIIKEATSLVNDKVLGDVNEEQLDMLGDVLNNVERLATIIDDLLDMSKLQSGKFKIHKKEVCCEELLNQVQRDFQLKASKSKISLDVVFDKNIASIYADYNRMMQVLVNLVGNAFKFTPSGGRISITAKDQGDNVKFVVKDTGRGIATADLPKVFGQFQQFGRVEGAGQKGTGLGLAISKSIVEFHGGRIGVHSELDKGTKIHFTIPCFGTYESMSMMMINDYIQSVEKQAQELKMTVLVLHIDQIMYIRSEYGTEAYENIVSTLQKITERCLKRGQDNVMRGKLGEMVVMLPETDAEGAASVSVRIQDELRKDPIVYDDGSKRASIEISMAIAPKDGNTAEKLFAVADNTFIKGRKILVVDDHPQIVQILKHRIQKIQGYKCIAANDGEEAINLAKKELPDLIICDIKMPKMSGYEVIGHLKEEKITRNIPIVILSAHRVESGKVEAITPGSIPVVSKTEGFDHLMEVVETLV